ncbi:hypothetical protein CDIK_2129 [Cucumispora dikerogammari]|nr:hypothetical protein CDIK_2129 [Cucumispora dikerogammari]
MLNIIPGYSQHHILMPSHMSIREQNRVTTWIMMLTGDGHKNRLIFTRLPMVNDQNMLGWKVNHPGVNNEGNLTNPGRTVSAYFKPTPRFTESQRIIYYVTPSFSIEDSKSTIDLFRRPYGFSSFKKFPIGSNISLMSAVRLDGPAPLISAAISGSNRNN